MNINIGHCSSAWITILIQFFSLKYFFLNYINKLWYFTQQLAHFFIIYVYVHCLLFLDAIKKNLLFCFCQFNLSFLSVQYTPCIEELGYLSIHFHTSSTLKTPFKVLDLKWHYKMKHSILGWLLSFYLIDTTFH